MSECYLSNWDINSGKAACIKQIGKLISKQLKKSKHEYIRRYTRVLGDGSTMIKYLGLTKTSAIKVIEDRFPLAQVFYNDAYLNWNLDDNWTGIPSIVVDVSQYVD